MPRMLGKGRAYPPDATCEVDGCTNRPRRQWLCQKHWNRWVRHGDAGKAHAPWALTEKSPYCVWGHDKREVGVASSGACNACNRRHSREQHRQRGRREREIPNLRNIRRRYRLTQNEFARFAGIHRNTVSVIEQGRKCRPSVQEKIIEATRRLMAMEKRKMQAWNTVVTRVGAR